MILKDKYYCPPPKDGLDFNELFDYATSVGAGLLADNNGIPIGSWKPESLAREIVQLDPLGVGVDIRTVQHWFQDNDKGISPNNINWVAHIFGCGDPDANLEWRAELSASNRRLAVKRREKRSGLSEVKPALGVGQTTKAAVSVSSMREELTERPKPRFNLAKKTEALFGSKSSMSLPHVMFIGACAVALISFTLNIHSIVFASESGPPKQVGFIWAPNWTLAHIVFIPLYLVFLIELLRGWNEVWRPKLAAFVDSAFPSVSWENRLTASSYTFWATLFVTVIIASGYNWTATHLIPLLNGDTGSWPINWGRIAIARPDLISIQSAVVFTGLAFFYNGITAYLFFTGLIFLHLMIHDYLDLLKNLDIRNNEAVNSEISELSLSLMYGIFRCTSLGVVITILMKLQSSFLLSDSNNIIEWLIADLLSPFGNDGSTAKEYISLVIAPGFFYSFFCLLAIGGLFVNASIQIRSKLILLHASKSRSRFFSPWVVMNGAMTLLVINYFLIGVLPGFTIFLLFSLVLTVYLLSKPVSTWGQYSQ